MLLYYLFLFLFLFRFSGYVSAHRMQWQLNQVNENIFPVLKYVYSTVQNLNMHMKFINIKLMNISNLREQLPPRSEDVENCTKKMKLSEPVVPEIEKIDDKVLQPALPMTCFHLRPRKCIDRSLEAKPNPAVFVKEVTDIEGFSEALVNLQKERSLTAPVNRSEQYPKIVFLGTGSCIPNKTRNVSSILVHTT